MRRRSPTRSAKAARSALDAQRRLSTAFGGFAGSKGGESAASEWLALGGEYQGLLKQLQSKKSATTKYKALQTLEGLLVRDDAETALKVMKQWVTVYRQLVYDADANVRSKAAEILGYMMQTLKKEALPFLKRLMGPWWCAQHDNHRSTAFAARSGFESVFPGDKAAEVVIYCKEEMTNYFIEGFRSTPDSVGNPQKEDKEDRYVRYEILMTGVLRGCRSFIVQLLASSKQDSIQSSLSMLTDALFVKLTLKGLLASMLVSVRWEAYELLGQVCTSTGDMVREYLPIVSPLIFNALGEKEAACHDPMWRLILAYTQDLPESWDHVQVDKTVMPKICSSLKGGYGSSEISYPAVGMFVRSIPSKFWNSSPQYLIDVFASAWKGLTHCRLHRALSEYTLDLLADIIVWGLSSANTLAPNDVNAFREQLIRETILKVLPWSTEAEDSTGANLSALFLQLAVACLTKRTSTPSECAVSTEADYSDIRGLVAKSISDDVCLRLGVDVPVMENSIIALFAQIAKGPLLDDAGAKIVVDQLVSPIAKSLKDKALSEDACSFDAASCLLAAGKASTGSLLQLPSYPSYVPLEVFAKIQALHEQGMDRKWLDVYTDLLIFALIKQPTSIRLTQWRSLLSHLLDLSATNMSSIWNLVEVLMTRLEVWLEMEDISQMKVDEMDNLLDALLGASIEQSIKARISVLLLRLQGTFLSGPSYMKLLHNLGQRIRSSGFYQKAENWIALPAALLSHSAVKDIDNDAMQIWSQIALELVLFAWDRIRSDALTWTEATKQAWENWKHLPDALPNIVGIFHPMLQDLLCECLSQSNDAVPSVDIPVDFNAALSEDDIQMGAWLAKKTGELMEIAGMDVSVLLDKLFDNMDGCLQWMETTTTKMCDFRNVRIACASSLIEFRGAVIFEDMPFVGPLFMEVLCTVGVSDVVTHAIGTFLTKLVEDGKSALTVELLKKCSLHDLDLSDRRCRVYRKAMDIMLGHLKDNAHNMASLAVLENFSTEWVERLLNHPRLLNIETEVSEREDDGYPIDHPSAVLSDLIPLFRSSLISVTKSSLDRLTGYYLEACLGRGDTHPDERIIWECIRICLPISETFWNEGAMPCSTPTERDALMHLSREQSADDRTVFDCWSRCLVYCRQEMHHDDWDSCFDIILSNLKTHVLRCEDLCEDLTEKATSVLLEASPSADITSPSMALELLHRLPVPLITDLEVAYPENENKEGFMEETLAWTSLLLLALKTRQHSTTVDQTDTQIRECIKQSVRLTFCVGICLVVESQATQSTGNIVRLFYELDHPTWMAVFDLFRISFEDRLLLPEMMESIDLWSEVTGVDALSALLQLSLLGDSMEGFIPLAMKLLVSDRCLSQMVSQMDHSEAEWEQMEIQGNSREAEYLIFAGFHSYIARTLEIESEEMMLMGWALVLTQLETESEIHQRRLSEMLRHVPALINRLLDVITDHLPLLDPSGKRSARIQLEEKSAIEKHVMRGTGTSLKELIQSIGAPETDIEWQALVITMYRMMIWHLSLSVRLWFNNLKSRKMIEAIHYYTTACESPALIQRVFSKIETEKLPADSNLKIKGNVSRREIVVTVEVEEETADLIIRFPECLPLKSAAVNGDTQAIWPSMKWRGLVFSMSTHFANHNEAIMDAIGLWRDSVDKLKNAITCLICFSILHPTTKQTPKLKCTTCQQKFHSDCLYTWFRQSSKSHCPHCQSPWDT